MSKVPHKLLLADDSVTIQRVIELTFADEDVQVAAVSDGDQAIARINAEPPDIVLADIGMPGKDGYEVAAHIKQTPWLAHIPVLLLTGAFEPVDQARVVAIGCDGVLAKPFEPQQVISRVRELLGRESASAQPLAPGVPPPLVALAQAAPSAQAAGNGDTLDEYFDRLDAAFADAANGQPPSALQPDAARDAPPGNASIADQIDWYAATTSQPHRDADVSLSYGSAQAAYAPAAPAAAASPGPVVPAGPVPSLADAFATLLAAEQASGMPAVAPTWPASSVAETTGDDVVQRITERVLAQLSDGVVRQTVSDLVSQIAERLVRDEIDRIKASIK